MVILLLKDAEFLALCEENKNTTAILQTIKIQSSMRQRRSFLFFLVILYESFLLSIPYHNIIPQL
jgi:hypothetical protein